MHRPVGTRFPLVLALIASCALSTAVGQTTTTSSVAIPMNATTVGGIGVGSTPSGAPYSLTSVQILYNGMPSSYSGPNFLIATPQTGVTPATVRIALNPSLIPYAGSGYYTAYLQFEVAPPAVGGTTIRLDISPFGPTQQPHIASVVSTASFQPAISPGELVSIFGSDLATQVLGQFDSTGAYPTDLGGNTVTFNGVAAPLIYTSPTRIDTIVPYEIAGQQFVTIQVGRAPNLAKSNPFRMTLNDTSPGVFTVLQNGSGQGVIYNAYYGQVPVTPNSVDNPAAKGTAITILATGAGIWLNPPAQNGSIVLYVFGPLFYLPVAPVSLTRGGQPAKVLWAGARPFEVSGMLQVNAIVPDNIGSGPQAVVLTIGQSSNLPQQVTVAVQ